MGNSQSCCTHSSPKGISADKSESVGKHSFQRYFPENADGIDRIGTGPPSSTNLQHISEREPDGEFHILSLC